MIEALETRIAPATFIVTSLEDSGAGSLRDAVAQANENEGADLIIFSKELAGTIKLAGEQLLITDTLTIKGPGSSKLAIDGDTRSRIVSVTDFADETDSKLTVSGLAFHNGVQATNDSAGGAIASTESLTVRDCVFTDNSSTEVGGAIRIFQPGDPSKPINLDVRDSSFLVNLSEESGGAISASIAGSVTIKNSLFQANFANVLGGAVSIDLAPGKIALLQGCKFLGNEGGFGGAVSVTGSDQSFLFIRGCVLTDNTAFNDGGALHLALPSLANGGSLTRIIASVVSGNAAETGGGVFMGPGSGNLDIVGCRIESNLASRDGGGVFVNEDANTGVGGNLGILKSRIIANVADGGSGGGIHVLGNGELLIRASQILQNSAENNGGGVSIAKQSPAVDRRKRHCGEFGF
jgi:hypothetical protein